MSVPWRAAMHINLAESYARLLGIKWRVQRLEELGSRYLKLMDSQVNFSHASKGRGSSARMRHVELQIGAHLAAGHLHKVVGCTRSDRKSADRGSRDIDRWRRHRLDSALAEQGRQEP